MVRLNTYTMFCRERGVHPALRGGSHRATCKRFDNTGLKKKVGMLPPGGLSRNMCGSGEHDHFYSLQRLRHVGLGSAGCDGTQVAAHTWGRLGMVCTRGPGTHTRQARPGTWRWRDC